jgi:hypothetical protein
MTDATEDKGAILFYTALMLLIGSVCILEIGGSASIVVVIIYCVMISIVSLGTLAQVVKPGTVGMQMGITMGADNLPTIDPKIYDKYMHDYEHRMSSIWFWMFALLTLAWPVVFLIGGFIEVAYISLASIVFAEIGKYRLYKAMKDHKQTWAAAAYINEIRNFFNKNVKM